MYPGDSDSLPRRKIMERDYDYNPSIMRFDKFAVHCMSIRGFTPSAMQLDAIKWLTFGPYTEAEYMAVGNKHYYPELKQLLGVEGGDKNSIIQSYHKTPLLLSSITGLFNLHLSFIYLIHELTLDAARNVAKERRLMANDLVWLAPRGWFKTSLLAMYNAYWLYIDPAVNIGYCSNSANTTHALVRDVLNLILTVPDLKPLIPSNDKKDNTHQTQTKLRTKYAQPKEASLWTVPLTGNSTGLRARVMIMDDLETATTSNTEDKRDFLRSRIVEFLRLSDSNTEQQRLLVGTPWNTDSVYYWACDTQENGGLGFKGRVYTARFPKLDEVPDYKGLLAPFILDKLLKDDSIVGTITDPQRIKESTLITQYRASKIDYYMNYMMNPFIKATDNYAFSLEDIGLLRYKSLDCYTPPFLVDTQPHTAKPELVPFAPNKTSLHLISPNLQSTSSYSATSRILYIDPSATGEDETAYCVLAVVNGNYVLERVGGYVDGSSEYTLQSLLDCYNSYSHEDNRNCITQVVFEKNFGAGMYRKLFDAYTEKLGIMVPTYDHHVLGKKEQRIFDTLTPVVNGRKFFITEECVLKDLSDYNDSSHPLSTRSYLRQYTFMYQLTHFYWGKGMNKSPFGVSGHDDRLDAVSSAVLYLGNLIRPSTDEDKAELERQEQNNYERFRQVFGQKMADIRYGHLSPDKIPKYARTYTPTSIVQFK